MEGELDEELKLSEDFISVSTLIRIAVVKTLGSETKSQLLLRLHVGRRQYESRTNCYIDNRGLEDSKKGKKANFVSRFFKNRFPRKRENFK